MDEQRDTKAALRVFDVRGSPCTIIAKSDELVLVERSPEQTIMAWHPYTINRSDFVDALNTAGIQLPQTWRPSAAGTEARNHLTRMRYHN